MTEHARTNKMEPAAVEGAILLKGSETFYAKRNLPVMYPVNFVHTGRLRRCVFCRGAGTSAHSAESHRDLRADRREGRAERRNSVYYSNGVTNASAVSIFRRHAAPIFRGSTSARSRQADAARPRLGRHCESGWIHSHCQPRRFGRGGNHGGTW